MRYKQPRATSPTSTSPTVAERHFHRSISGGWSGASAMIAERDFKSALGTRAQNQSAVFCSSKLCRDKRAARLREFRRGSSGRPAKSQNNRGRCTPYYPEIGRGRVGKEY